jgi:PQQ enzyme repeat
MKPLVRIFSLVIAGLCAISLIEAQVNVTQEHNNLSRDGLYVDPAFTLTAASNLTRNMKFDGTISGNVYAQPLYVEGGPAGRAKVIVATESNNVYALDAVDGSIIWQRNVGPPVSSGLPCGNISPLGITGTPVVDLPSRSLFFDAMINGATKRHFIYSLNVDTGAVNPGWPVDVNARAAYNGTAFTSLVQNERSALGLVNGVVYVPYSGHYGDCGTYHGWVVGVPINNPASVTAWATTAVGGGIWGHGGVASDGTNMFVITGNTFNTRGNWGGGEAVIRLQAGPVFSGNPIDYWAPINWLSLDNGDTDLGGCGPVLIDVPGATPSQLVLALGKDGNAYLLNRNNLGGITTPVTSANVASYVAGQSAANYRTNQGTYFVFRNGSSSVSAYKITATNPPAITSAWSVSQTGKGSPWVTTTNGTNNAIVWVAGAEGDQCLHGYDGDTGAVVYAGGGPNEVMANTRKWNTGIVARGRIYFAADNKVYAFTVSTGTPTPTPTPTPTATPTATPIPTPTPALSGLTYNGGTPFVDGTSLTQGISCTVTANPNTHTQSVVFNRDGSVRTDSVTPFDLTWRPNAIGTHTLVATPWSSIGGTGTSGPSITVHFNVVAASPTPTPAPTPALSGLTYNGGTPFVEGTSLIQGTSYTVTAPANAYTQSVLFSRDGLPPRVDSAIPFDYTWRPNAIGTHTLVATPWSSVGGTGTSGPSITVHFNVVAASPTPIPTATP